MKKLFKATVFLFLIFLVGILGCSGASSLQEGVDYNLVDTPAKGKLADYDFAVQDATVSHLGILHLREGQDFIAMREIIITFPLKKGEKIAGRTIKVGKGSPLSGMLSFIVPRPMVQIKWQGDNGLNRRGFIDGFVLVVVFGEDQEDGYSVPGKIYYQTTWEGHEDHVVGSFTAIYH